MKKISVTKLYNYNYSVEVAAVLKQDWRIYNSFSCFGMPKEKNIFLYIDSCKAEYTLLDGSKLYAKSGDIVYAPTNFEYSVCFYDFETPAACTIGINFMLFDKQREPFVLSNGIKIFTTADPNYKLLFSQIDNHAKSAVVCPARLKSCMYDILANISTFYRDKKIGETKFSIISKGIAYLENDNEQAMSIKEIAAMCNVSEIYFRRLFKEYSGLSPVEYRISSKIKKAKNFLKYENMSISEISDYLGFVDTAYFTKQFKAKTGMTPSEYKVKSQEP